MGLFFLILLITYLTAKIVAGIVNWLLERKLKLSQLAENLISRMIKNVIMLIGFAIALTALEIDITPILAAIGAAGFIIGFALQGTLSNFASGLMILINRPFDEGDVVEAHELVLMDPEPAVVLHELADSCVNIVCRPWVKTADYWTVKTEVTRRVKQRFDRAGISIPYPQRDVHVYQHAVAASD